MCLKIQNKLLTILYIFRKKDARMSEWNTDVSSRTLDCVPAWGLFAGIQPRGRVVGVRTTVLCYRRGAHAKRWCQGKFLGKNKEVFIDFPNKSMFDSKIIQFGKSMGKLFLFSKKNLLDPWASRWEQRVLAPRAVIRGVVLHNSYPRSIDFNVVLAAVVFFRVAAEFVSHDTIHSTLIVCFVRRIC